MPADINAYALGLELQLQIAPAMDALDKFSAALKNIQKDVSNVSKAPSAGGALVMQQEVTIVDALAKANIGLTERVNTLQDAQHNAMLQGLSMNDAMEAQEEVIRKSAMQVKFATAQLEKLLKLERELTEDEKKLKIQIEDKLEQLEKSSKQLQKDKDTYKAHNEFIKSLTTSVYDTSQEFKSLLSTITSVPAEFGKAGIAMALYIKGLADVIRMQTEYAPSTMRALGSQEDLIRMTNKLRATLGVSSQEGVETFKALSAAGFTAAQDLTEVAETNIRFSKSTGVAQSTVAEYQRRLEFLTGSSQTATKALNAMSNMIVKTGLDAAKAAELLGILASSADALALYYGTEQAKAYQKELVAIAGMEQKIAGRTSLSTAYTKILADPRARLELRRFGIVLSDNASATENYSRVLEGLSDASERYGSIALQSMLAGTGIGAAEINDAKAMLKVQRERNMTHEQFLQSLITGEGLVANSEASWSDLTSALNRAANAFMSIWSSLAEDLGPVLKFIAYILVKVVQAFTFVIEKLMDFRPTRILLQGIGVVLGVVFGMKMLSMVKSFGMSILNLGKSLKSLASTATSAGQAVANSSKMMAGGPGAGAGIKIFMTNLAEGIKAFGDPKVLFGVIVLGVLAAVVGGTLIAVAIAIEKFNLSAADIGLAAGGLILASVAFYIMAAALSVLGPVAAYVGPLLFPLAIAFLAIGAAVTLAGLGIKLAAEGIAELFQVVIDGGMQFIASIFAMSFAFPLLSAGVALLGASLLMSAPAILLGFGALLIAAGMAAIANPVLADTGAALMNIAMAASMVRGGAGAGLISLAKGITAFMGALMGIAAIGAAGQIASFFGVVKSPIAQAQQIGKAIAAIMEPASQLSHAVDRLATIGDFMKPLVDSVLMHEDDIKRTLAILKDTAEQIQDINKMVEDGNTAMPFTAEIPRAKPVTAITQRDAIKAASEERMHLATMQNQKDVLDTLRKIEIGGNSDASMKALIDILREWLPKIARKEDAAGLASSFSQWGG